MSRHLEQVLAHAENELAATGAKRPTEILPVYKKFLKIEEHRLRLKHQAGGGGREICMLRVKLVDILLRHVFAAAVSAAGSRESATELPLALVALGGYGRGELNPASDVDVMLLHGPNRGKISPYIEKIVEEILYSLWDVGFKVGHSTRSIKDAIAQANQDMLTKTAMLESRYLTGNEKLARIFREQFLAKCVAGHEREYFEARVQDQPVVLDRQAGGSKRLGRWPGEASAQPRRQPPGLGLAQIIRRGNCAPTVGQRKLARIGQHRRCQHDPLFGRDADEPFAKRPVDRMGGAQVWFQARCGERQAYRAKTQALAPGFRFARIDWRGPRGDLSGQIGVRATTLHKGT